MRIAINTRFLLPHKMEGFGWYTFEVTKRMVLAHPEHEFYFFFDRAYDERFLFAKNVKPVVLFPPARHPFLFIWWFERSVKNALKKYEIDLFFSPDGYLSLGSNVPQIGVIHDLNFEHFPQDVPKLARWYLRKYTPKFAKKATQLLTVSEYSRQDLHKTYGIDLNKITVAWNGASELFHPLVSEQREEIRTHFCHGNPYFIFVGSLHPRKNLKNLLRAFAQLAEQNSTHDLLIVGSPMWDSLDDIVIPEGVKSRVHFTGHVDQQTLCKLMGAAFALTYVPYFEGFGIPLVEAMYCHLPILAGNLTCLPEVAGEAAIYVDPFDVDAITKGMLELISNETLYHDLKLKSAERSKLFSWDKTAEGVWEILEKTLDLNNLAI